LVLSVDILHRFAYFSLSDRRGIRIADSLLHRQSQGTGKRIFLGLFYRLDLLLPQPLFLFLFGLSVFRRCVVAFCVPV
jgi:hypothetical protein